MLMLLPFLLVFGLFLLYPLVGSVAMSVQAYAGPESATYVGSAQYRFVLGDVFFWVAVANTVGYTLLFLLIQIPVSLAIAVALNAPRVRCRAAFRLAMLLPFLVGNVLVAVLFTALLSPRQGLVPRVVSALFPGLELSFKTDPVLATVAIVAAGVWLTIGWGMVYLLAALQGVRPELYEAARIDGASGWQRFRHITIPGIRPVLSYLILVGTVSGLQLFELPYVFFQGLGPRLRGLTVVQYLVLRGFDRGDLGLASAVGWVLVVLIGLFAAAQWPLHRDREQA